MAAMLVAVAALSACGAGGFKLSKVDADRSIVTSSVPASEGGQPDRTRVSDETTIRNAVSSASVQEVAARPLAWTNAETESRGAITALRETRENGRICRSFMASRESYDGVQLYSGEACAAGDGLWLMRSFRAL